MATVQLNSSPLPTKTLYRDSHAKKGYRPHCTVPCEGDEVAHRHGVTLSVGRAAEPSWPDGEEVGVAGHHSLSVLGVEHLAEGLESLPEDGRVVREAVRHRLHLSPRPAAAQIRYSGKKCVNIPSTRRTVRGFIRLSVCVCEHEHGRYKNGPSGCAPCDKTPC